MKLTLAVKLAIIGQNMYDGKRINIYCKENIGFNNTFELSRAAVSHIVVQ